MKDMIIIIIVIIALMANTSSIIGHGQCHLQENTVVIVKLLPSCQLATPTSNQQQQQQLLMASSSAVNRFSTTRQSHFVCYLVRGAGNEKGLKKRRKKAEKKIIFRSKVKSPGPQTGEECLASQSMQQVVIIQTNFTLPTI